MSLAAVDTGMGACWHKTRNRAIKNAKRRRLEVMCIKAEDADDAGSDMLQDIANGQRAIVVVSGGTHRGRIFWPGER